MNSSSGLVRRARARPEESSEANGGGGTSATNLSDYNDNLNNETEDTELDCDSKETRLTLMEEVLLLGLKDKEVSYNRQQMLRNLCVINCK